MKILITKGTTVLESRIEFGIPTPEASLTQLSHFFALCTAETDLLPPRNRCLRDFYFLILSFHSKTNHKEP